VAHPLTWLDVFTATPLHGNGLAVVHDADDLDDATMLAFVRETRLSETTFVQAPRDRAADYVNRIWTMGGELPFAGHPSLGTAVAIAHARGERIASYVQQTPAGLQPIDVELAGDRARASMLQGPAEHLAEVDRGSVAAAAGLKFADLHPDLPPQVVSTGQPHLIAPVRDAAVLDRVAPTFDGLAQLAADAGCTVLYLATVDPAAGTAQARGFFVDPGVLTEDPATGSAAGPLCAYLHARTGTDRLTVRQGTAMGRPSVVATAVEGARVRVGGDVVVLSTGSLLL